MLWKLNTTLILNHDVYDATVNLLRDFIDGTLSYIFHKWERFKEEFKPFGIEKSVIFLCYIAEEWRLCEKICVFLDWSARILD